MKLHELKQRRNTIAAQMRTLHDTIGENPWSEEQRTEWNKAKTELDSIDTHIQREEDLRSLDQRLVDEQEPAQRNNPAHPETEQAERRTAAFDKYLRHGLGEMTAEERQALRELRAQGTTPDEKGGYTVPLQMLNKVVESMKAYGGIASVAQILTT
ncbi:phage major capsid protein, partial [Xenorhabdus lircayensis]|uniref:phage major capsid protein n=1 Tax=Xenorhabdus lircayensis TaxID=2763499 RepID=UPI001E2B8E72